MKPSDLIVALPLVLLCAEVAPAAGLAEYQQRALQNRPVVEQQRRNLEIRETDWELARTGYRPSLDLSYTANVLDEDTFFEDKHNSVAAAAVTWNLFRGFRDDSLVDQASYLREAEAHRLRGVSQDIYLDVALRYLAIYTNRANLSVERNTAATLEKLHTDAGNRYELGLIKKNDLLKFKVDLDNAVLATRRAEAEVGKAVRSLGRAVAEPVAAEELAFDEFAELPRLAADGEAAELEQRMLAQRSELQALRQQEVAAVAGADVERADFYPSLDLTASYRNYDGDLANSIYDDDNDELRGQLLLTFNIYDGNRKRLNVAKATQEARLLRYQRLEVENDLRAILANLVLDYGVSRDNAGVALASIEQAEENLRITRLSYKEGLSTETDLLDATANLSRAKFNYVAAKSEAFTNYFLILRAVEEFPEGG